MRMKSSFGVLFAALAAVVVLVAEDAAAGSGGYYCPDVCECKDGNVVDCSGRGLTEIPSGVPSNTVSL